MLKEIEKLINHELAKTPDLKLGDFGAPVLFRIKNPEEVIEKVKELGYVEEVIKAGGYLNVKLNRAKVLEYLLSFKPKKSVDFSGKIVVEHTSVNPNKAMHIGHLRNACIGDSIARFLRELGYEVEVHNYIDDTGVQVAATLLGFIGLENIEKIRDEKFIEEVKKKIEEIENIDEYCWNLYSEVYKKYSEEELSTAIKKILREIEDCNSPVHDLAVFLAERILEKHLSLLHSIGITYDFLPRESDILKSGLWSAVFEEMKKSKNFVYETQGKNAGCWVVKLSEHENFKNLKDPDKVIVRSDGTVTYTGKDIAYHFWKFGIVKKDIGCRKFKFGAYISSYGERCGKEFGNARRVINVIDVRQSYAQDVVKACLQALGYEEEARNFIHYAYEVVALSDKSTGYFKHMSGRKGIGIMAQELVKALKRIAR